jgi:hypothetical protein
MLTVNTAEAAKRFGVPTNLPTDMEGDQNNTKQVIWNQCARVAKSADAKDLEVRSGQSLFRAIFESVRAWRNRQTHRT